MKRDQLVSDLRQRFDSFFAPLKLERWESNEAGFELLSLSLKRKRFDLLCAVEYRPTPAALRTRVALLQAEARKRGHKGGVGVLTTHMSRPSIELCQTLGLACFDLDGTCLLSERGTYIKVVAIPHKSQIASTPEVSFSGSRANVIRVLLSDRKRIWNVRALADAACVSGGQVSKAIKPLVALDAIEARRGTGGIRVIAPGIVLDTWADHYLPPGVALIYTSRDSVDQLEARLAQALTKAKLPYAFTGFSGNALLTASGRYTEAAVYVVSTSALIQRLAADLGLIPSLDVPKVVLRCVADSAILVGAKTVRSRVVATPAQVYLDLMKNGQRGPEAAHLLRTMVMNY